MKRRRDKGASFCHESNVPNPIGDNFLATGGTQKCSGVNPSLRSTPRKQVNSAAVAVIPPYKEVGNRCFGRRSKLLPTFCWLASAWPWVQNL